MHGPDSTVKPPYAAAAAPLPDGDDGDAATAPPPLTQSFQPAAGTMWSDVHSIVVVGMTPAGPFVPVYCVPEMVM